MKVLFQNREDALTRWGGDTTQMMKTKTALESMGVQVSVNLVSSPSLNGFDLVHVFNVQTAPYSVLQVRNAKDHGTPLLLSPIYWDKRHISRSPETYRYHERAAVRCMARLSPLLPTLYFNHLSPGRKHIQSRIVEMLDGADHLLPNSLAELEILCVLFDRPSLRARSSVIVNAIDAEDATAQGVDSLSLLLPEGDLLLQVGRFEPIKGQLKLIRAMRQHKEIPLVFIGGNMDSLYGQTCQKEGQLRGNTFFLQHIAHESLPAIYRRARVHALPSMRESPGLVTLEAAVQGANCVVSIHGPVIEYFGAKAWVCDPASEESIEQAVVSAWEAPRTGELGRSVQNEFTWERAGRQTLAAYEHLLTHRRHSRDSCR